MKGRRAALVWLAGAVCALLYFALGQSAAARKSAAYDEAVHLLSGYRILTAGDFDFNHEHPPLMKVLAAAPVVLTGAARPLEPWTYKREADEWPLSHNWLYHENDGDRLLALGRMPIAVVGALLVLAVFAAAWIAARTTAAGAGAAAPAAGAGAAMAAGLLAAVEPNLLAHGSLITTDLGMAAFFFAASIAYWRYLETRARGWLALAGLLWGLNLLAKFSAVVLGPVFLAMGVADWLARRPSRDSAAAARETRAERRARERRQARRPARGREAASRPVPSGIFAAPPLWERGDTAPVWRWLLPVAATGLIALVVLNAGYGFHHSFSTLKSMKLESREFRQWAGSALGSIPIPAPAPFVAGFDHAQAAGQRWWSYLMGDYSMTGWRYYYLVALAVKTSIPLMLLALAGVLLAPRTGTIGARTVILLCLPPVVFMAFFTISGNLKNIGLRYVLPVYPFLCLFGGLGAAALFKIRLRRFGRAAAVVLLVWAAGAEARIYPDHLAYFNEIAGGPEGGRWWLLDSNIDWGQDLKGLAAWMKSHHVDSIYLDYFGRACPRYYGIRAKRRLEPGYLAVSATNLAGVYSENKHRYDFLRGVSPVAVIGHSILVYKVDNPPASGGEGAQAPD